MIVLIPAYEPDDRLVDLVRELRAASPESAVLVVDDGSGPAYASIFEAVADLGCDVISYGENRGKGHALKVGFGHIARRFPNQPVVTADSDGQHRTEDILRVGERLAEGSETTLVLGSRDFRGHVPFRSRFGNTITRLVFAVSTGRRITDTQTGLRAYPAGMLDWLQSIEGDRFEYEINVLLQAVEEKRPIEEVTIETVYLEANRSSHFRPLADSVRVYAPLLRFSLSSLVAFLLDFVLLLILQAATGDLLVSVVGARVVSSVFNYLTNRHLVFAEGPESGLLTSVAGYFALAAAILAANYTLMYTLTERLSLPIVPSKLATESLLFIASYLIQKRVIFVSRPREQVEGARATVDAAMPSSVHPFGPPDLR